MIEGMRNLKANGQNLMYALYGPVLAEGYLAAGRPAEGLAALQEAIVQAQRYENRSADSELHRLKGELLLLAGASESDAEKSLREAIAIAQRHEARSWELRAATSLARLLRKQGKVVEVRRLLAEIYGWFTEGFDTADLKDAKALLDDLSA